MTTTAPSTTAPSTTVVEATGDHRPEARRHRGTEAGGDAGAQPPAMSAQELASLEAELSAIDAILNELAQNFSAD